jgi:hypothetical protein
MNEQEMFLRLAEIRASGQTEMEKCGQAFFLIASFLQNTGNASVPFEVKKRLRNVVDEFYLSARAEQSTD